MSNGHAGAPDSMAAFAGGWDEAVEKYREVSRFVVESLDGRPDDREAASSTLWRTLQALDGVGDERLRRELASRLGFLCYSAGFDDLALFSLDIALELGEQAGDVPALENDLLTLGNVHLRLGNLAEAESAWQRVHGMSVARGAYANAASASTNLGGLLAQEGRIPEAVVLLERSLEYLGQAEFPETEMNTRFLLTQVLFAQDADVDRVLDMTGSLRGWADQLADSHRERLAEVVEQALAHQPGRRSEFEWLLDQA